jgi:hypothetical protein
MTLNVRMDSRSSNHYLTPWISTKIEAKDWIRLATWIHQGPRTNRHRLPLKPL